MNHINNPSSLPTPADPYRLESYPSPMKQPLTYPGMRPDFSFVTMPNGDVLPISVHENHQSVTFCLDTRSGQGTVLLDEMLEGNGVLPMADRIPIVGFGSNASPGQLVHKFSERFSEQLSRDNDKFIIPTLFGQLKDVAVAYSSKFGLRSYVFAELMAAAGLNTNVAINFCSPEQLEAIKISEGAYHLCDFGKEVAVPGLKRTLPAYGFAGKNNVVLYPSNGNDPDDKK